MKRLLMLILTIGTSFSAAFASFPDTWNGVFFSSPTGAGDELPPHAMYYTFYLSGDTIISDMKYQKLYLDGEYPVLGRVSQHYVASIRSSTDAKQVYIYTKDEEYLLFDFSVKIGDVCHVYLGVEAIFFPEEFAEEDVVRDLVVISVEDYGGHPSIVLKDNFSSRTRWIKGVGSTIGLTSYTAGYTGVTDPILLCASQDDQQVYMAPDEEVSSWGYKNACPIVEPVVTGVPNLAEESPVSSPCHTIMGTLAGDDYRGIVIHEGKVFLKQ